MALGGVLRAAIRAGRFGEAARQSRRQARALRSLNETGGVGRFQRQLPFEERGFERMSGRAFGATPRGNAVVVDPATGRRTVLNQNFDDFMEAGPLPRSPIAAPYEGVRVWGGRTDDGFPRSFDAPPPWMGRGPAPETRRTLMYDPYYGDEFPSGFPRSRYDEPFTMFEPLPFARPSDPNIQYGGNLPYSSFFYGTGY